MDRIDSLRAFVQVVDRGGFAAAAREMGLSRSAVNKAVVALEEELGTQLLTRSTRRVVPTDVGLAFYDRAQVLLNDFDESFASIRERSSTPQGTLRINAPMSFSTSHLSGIVVEFMERYPQVHVELSLNDRFVDPIEEGFDVTVRVGAPRVSTSLISRDVALAKRILCAAPGYLQRYGAPTTPAELKHHRCLHYGYQASGSQWRLYRAGEERVATISCVMWANNGEMLRDAAIGEQGIVLLPTFVVSKALAQGELVRLMPDYEASALTVSALYPRHRHLSPKVRLFVDLLAQRLAKHAGGAFEV
nr:LysR family transcriptional regulator [Oceanococcus sp. HetDA_MAG_MS8]